MTTDHHLLAQVRYGAPPGIRIDVDPATVRDLRGDALDADGRLRVLPAAYWATTTALERNQFGMRHGLYSFPTTELVAHLRGVIRGRRAIEIGAGHGVLAAAVGIPATDSHQQNKEPYRSYYRQHRQPTVPYGPNVVDEPAWRAVRLYHPDVVIAAWVTHRYDPARHAAGGNEGGVDEADLLRRCTYIVIGNEQVHADKSIWDRPHTIDYPPWLYSRAINGSRDFIATWTKGPR
jgi:hypothetical protein